jgi:hypothetical protein
MLWHGGVSFCRGATRRLISIKIRIHRLRLIVLEERAVLERNERPLPSQLVPSSRIYTPFDITSEKPCPDPIPLSDGKRGPGRLPRQPSWSLAAGPPGAGQKLIQTKCGINIAAIESPCCAGNPRPGGRRISSLKRSLATGGVDLQVDIPELLVVIFNSRCPSEHRLHRRRSTRTPTLVHDRPE